MKKKRKKKGKTKKIEQNGIAKGKQTNKKQENK